MSARFRGTVVAMMLTAGLTGCANTLTSINKTEELLTGAAPLVTDDMDTVVDGKEKQYLGKVLSQSEQKCHLFVGSLSAAARTSDSVLDVGTTIFSALATAFHPLTTVHALTAGATITSGSKTALNADIYQKETAPIIVKAIEDTYYKDYTDYVYKLSGETEVVTSLEVAKIRAIHRECALDAALSHVLSGQPSRLADHEHGAHLSTTDLVTGARFSVSSGDIYVVVAGPAKGSDVLSYSSLEPAGTSLSAARTIPTKDFLRMVSGQ